MKEIPIDYDEKIGIDEMDDHILVPHLLNRSEAVTTQFLYYKCGKWFNKLFSYFYTDCEAPIELADEVYTDVMAPCPPDNKSKLLRFNYNSPLYFWFCRMSKNFCIDRWRRRKIQFYSFDDMESRFDLEDNSIAIIHINKDVVSNIINNMTNKRYSKALQYRFIEGLDIDSSAKAMGESKAMFSRTLYKAKKQFKQVFKELYPDLYQEIIARNGETLMVE